MRRSTCRARAAATPRLKQPRLQRGMRSATCPRYLGRGFFVGLSRSAAKMYGLCTGRSIPFHRPGRAPAVLLSVVAHLGLTASDRTGRGGDKISAGKSGVQCTRKCLCANKLHHRDGMFGHGGGGGGGGGRLANKRGGLHGLSHGNALRRLSLGRLGGSPSGCRAQNHGRSASPVHVTRRSCC